MSWLYYTLQPKASFITELFLPQNRSFHRYYISYCSAAFNSFHAYSTVSYLSVWGSGAGILMILLAGLSFAAWLWCPSDFLLKKCTVRELGCLAQQFCWPRHLQVFISSTFFFERVNCHRWVSLPSIHCSLEAEMSYFLHTGRWCQGSLCLAQSLIAGRYSWLRILPQPSIILWTSFSCLFSCRKSWGHGRCWEESFSPAHLHHHISSTCLSLLTRQSLSRGPYFRAPHPRKRTLSC